MKQNKIVKNLFATVFISFVAFFVSANGVQNYYDNKKLLLFVNGSYSSSVVDVQTLNINVTMYGFWNNGTHEYETNDKYILLRMKTREVLLSTNNLEDIVEYTSKK